MLINVYGWFCLLFWLTIFTTPPHHLFFQEECSMLTPQLNSRQPVNSAWGEFLGDFNYYERRKNNNPRLLPRCTNYIWPPEHKAMFLPVIRKKNTNIKNPAQTLWEPLFFQRQRFLVQTKTRGVQPKLWMQEKGRMWFATFNKLPPDPRRLVYILTTYGT